MNFRRFSWILTLLVISSLSASAQPAFPDSVLASMARLVEAYNHFGRYNVQEKVYLHFDNTGYFLGETMWFKAYVVAAPQLRPTELSRVLYVELLTPEGRVVETKKLKIVDGKCHGEFLLAGSTLIGGFYEVRAYTRAMLNWEGTVFSRVFPVFDRPETDGEYNHRITHYARSFRLPDYRQKQPDMEALNLSFYPEGGVLVAGLPSVVAFKATDKLGRGVALSGGVYDANDRLLTTFTTQHNGMGRFVVTPGNEPCKVKISDGRSQKQFTLPAAKPQGYTMTVDNLHGEEMLLTLRRSAATEGQLVGLMVACRGLAHTFELVDMRSDTLVSFSLPKDNFPAGVQQITLFTSQGEVLAERLAFHRGDRQIVITVDSLKSHYKPMERVNLSFTMSDERGNPIEGDFSLSVRDYATEVPTYYQSQVVSNLLLESDLKGYIEDIPYYFEADDRRHREDLDLLMLVQGWRRYEWRQQAGVEPFEPEHFVEEGIVVKGNVYDYHLFGAKAKAGVELSVWIYSPLTNSHGKAFTDENGGFVFLSDSDIWGKNNLVLQTQTTNRRGKKKNKAYGIELDRSFSPPALAYPPLMATLPDTIMNPLEEVRVEMSTADTSDNADLDNDVIVRQLSQVDVKAERVQGYDSRVSIEYVVAEEEDKLIDSKVRHYTTSSIPDLLEQINPFFVISESWSDEKDTVVSQYLYKGKRARFGFFRYNEGGDYSFDKTRNLLNVFPEDVKTISIIEYPSYVAIRLYEYPANERKKYKKGYRATTLQGYSVPEEFFHVDYSVGVLPDAQDFRRTLYWDPDVKTDSTGRAWVSFYNNSSETRLRISAETLTSDGVPGCYE